MSLDREYRWHVKLRGGPCPICGCIPVQPGREHRRMPGLSRSAQYEQRHHAVIESVAEYKKPTPTIQPLT